MTTIRLSAMKPAWKASKTRRVLYADLIGRCAYCGSGLADIWAMTVDHVIPRSRGGSDDRSNLKACCKSCNATKHNRSLEYLRAALRRRQNGTPYFTATMLDWFERMGVVLPEEPPYHFFFEQLEAANNRRSVPS